MASDARVDVLTPDVAAWLVAEGGALVDEVAVAIEDGADALAIGTDLRRRGLAPDRAATIVDVATARRLADAADREAGVEPIPGRLVTRASLEQASHPLVAAHRARRFAGRDQVVDLGCGVGGDAIAIARTGAAVHGVDRDEARLLLCRHNALAAGVDVDVEVGDALAPPGPPGATAHADPGRRPGGRRVGRLAEYEPPVGDLVASLAGRPGAGIVLSPAVDLGDPDLPDGEVEFVQVDGRLVEAAVWLGDLAEGDATATLLAGGAVHQWRRSGPPVDVAVTDIGGVLVEPAPALVRARLHGELAQQHGATRVSAGRALLTTDDEAIADSPWATSWQVEAVLPGRPREVARWLRTAEPLPLSISLHGDRRPVESWWAAAKGQPRGPIGRRLLVVDTSPGALAVLGRPLPPRIA